MSKLAPISGHFKFGYHVEYGYFEQLASKSSSSKTIYADFQTSFPDLNDREIRSSLGSFLFSGNEVNKQLKSLSGGELVRLELCKLLEKKPNVLILDEPTNHMDIASKEAFERLLSSYTGTVIFVSHDRYFTNKIANKLLVFKPNETVIFEGKYNDYINPQTKKLEEITKEIENKPKTEKVEYPIDFDDPKETDPILQMNDYELRKERNRSQSLIQKLEEKSKLAEDKLKQLNNDFVDPEIATDFIKLMEIQAEIEKTQSQSDKCAEDWLEVSDKLSIITSLLDKNKEENES